MNSNDAILIEVEGVSKKFSRSLKQSMWYGLKDLMSAFLGMNRNRSALRKGEFWAVKEVSFSLKRGDCLGLIGHNGAGKSTLLKMLNGLIRPDEGRITMRGKVGALIELGAGFNPILTGRENIYVNGQLLGFSRKEINEKFQAIIDFAEIGEFLDSPVQNYSSGMKVRLGFSIAAQMEPDVLIIDEVLAVGDAGFKIKCLNRIREILKNSAVIFVSHSMEQIAKTSTSIILLDKGKIEYHDVNVIEGVQMYFSKFSSEKFTKFGDEVEITSFNINDREAIGNSIPLKYGEDLHINFKFRSLVDLEQIKIVILFSDKNMHQLASCNSGPIHLVGNRDEEQSVKVTIPETSFTIGNYGVTVIFFRYLPLSDQLFLSTRYNFISEINVKTEELTNLTSLRFKGIWEV